MKKLFITATDTDAGKTFVSCALINALTQHNKQKKTQVASFKPVAAGCELINGQLINEDAKLLSQYANCGQSITEINPITFLEPIAPHIAAKKNNQQVLIENIEKDFSAVSALNADFIVVEGAGGWRLPLGAFQNRQQFMSDFVKKSKLDVVLVVNMKLGCLNHALLTYEAIKSDGLHCIAWVANSACPEPMNNLAENIEELRQLLPAPMIAQLDYFPQTNESGESVSLQENISFAASQINLSPLFI